MDSSRTGGRASFCWIARAAPPPATRSRATTRPASSSWSGRRRGWTGTGSAETASSTSTRDAAAGRSERCRSAAGIWRWRDVSDNGPARSNPLKSHHGDRPVAVLASPQMPGLQQPPADRREPRRARVNLRKLMFVLPNLFTVSSIFCGVYSITLSAGEPTGDNFYRAAVAIFFGSFFDAFDGRVARLTRTQSEFGVELDSLADVITFGVAPAILVYKWALAGIGTPGIAICSIYAACGAIRLARFNVLAHAESGTQRYFVGLPIPLAAGMLVALVIALNDLDTPVADTVGLWPIAMLVLVLAFLMVSTIRYRTFKEAGLNPRTILVFLLITAVGVAVAIRGRPSLVLLVYFSIYILLGLAEEVLFGRRRRAAARATAAVPPARLPEPDEPLLPAEEDEVPLEGTATAAAGSGNDGEHDA